MPCQGQMLPCTKIEETLVRFCVPAIEIRAYVCVGTAVEAVGNEFQTGQDKHLRNRQWILHAKIRAINWMIG